MKYIDKLTDDDWDNIIGSVNYKLDRDNVAKSPRPYVDKGLDDPEPDKITSYLLRVVKTDEDLITAVRLMMGLFIGKYDDNCDLIVAEDYYIHALCQPMYDEDSIIKLQQSFYDYMSKKFDSYDADYEKYWNYIKTLEDIDDDEMNM